MDTPVDTLLVVLLVVGSILALLLYVSALQAWHRDGVMWWAVAFAIHPASQTIRELVGARAGHDLGLLFGHLGGPVAYGVLYLGVRRYLGQVPRDGFAMLTIAVAAVISTITISIHLSFASLASISCITALFEALIAAAMWQAWQRDGGLARIVAASVFGLSMLGSLARAVSVVPAWHPYATLMPANTAWLLIFIAALVLQAGCLLFLVNQGLLDELRNMADYDTLTGLLNRGGLARRMQRQGSRTIATGKRLGVLCLDLDHFKLVNDNHGHGAGDDVLKQMGVFLRANCRPRDIPSRQGGEEFGMIVEARSEAELVALGERLRTLVERLPFATRAGELAVTVSIGVALTTGPDDALEAVCDRADLALLRAKRCGRNRVMLGVAGELAIEAAEPGLSEPA